MAANIPSKYDDISSKDLIHCGSPTVYQLTPKKDRITTQEKDINITRMTLGTNTNKMNKTILLVGETGAGKSTLINALVNYAIGVTWEDDVWFEIVEKDEKISQYESRTLDVIVYQIFGFEDKTLPYSLTIVDTPGYGDTTGTERDAIISKRLFDLFHSHEGVYEINAVGLVIKASDNRLSDRLRYIFDSVVSLFGKDMEKNIVTLVTHSDGRTPKDALKALEAANVKCAQDEKNQPLHFLFNNCQNAERNNMFALEPAWKISWNGMSAFTEFLRNLKAQNLRSTTDVLKTRIRLTAGIKNLQERIEFIELKQKEIEQTQELLQKHEQAMKSNEEFTVKVDEPYKDKVDIVGGMRWLFFYEGAVNCTKCEETCHHPGCTISWYPRDCEVMRGGVCTACTGKCPVSKHVKEKQKYEIKTRKVSMTWKDIESKWTLVKDKEDIKKTLQDVQKKYEEGKTGRDETTSALKNLEKEMEELQKVKDQWLDKSFKLIDKLKQIALNVESLSTLVHLDFLIQRMKEKGDAEKVKQLEEMKSQEDEGTRSALQYKLTAAGRADKEATK